jgi:hypothetical protein
VPLCLPPHSTDRLQPLDVGVFNCLADAYKNRLFDYCKFSSVQNIGKDTFISLIDGARDEGIAAHSIARGWREAGLYSYNPAEVLGEPLNRPFTPQEVAQSTVTLFTITRIEQLTEVIKTDTATKDDLIELGIFA